MNEQTHFQANCQEAYGFDYEAENPKKFRDTLLTACGKRVALARISATPNCKQCRLEREKHDAGRKCG